MIRLKQGKKMKFFFSILLSLPVALALSADELVTSWRGVAGEASAPPAIIESKTPQGKTAFRAKPVVNGAYQGMACDVKQVFDPKKYLGIEFFARQSVVSGKAGVVFRLDQTAIPGSPVRQAYSVVNIGNKWEKIFIPFDVQNWNAPEGADKLAPVKGFSFYPFASLSHPGVDIEIGQIRLVGLQDNKPRKLKVSSYRYINSPTSGDKNCTELTDGNIRTGAYYRQYSNDAEVIFDLGAIYAVTGIDVGAFCPPGHNFTELMVSASSDDKNFTSWGSVKNTMDGGNSVEMRVSGQGYAIGRYFKIRAAKIRPDFFTWLGEVAFTGYIPSAQEKIDFQQKSYDLGPEIEAPDMGKYAKLRNSSVTANVNLRNSVINGVSVNGQRYVERIANFYTLQTRKNDIEISGYDDKVIKVLEQNSSSVTLLCRNKKLPGIDLIKKFFITSNGDLMTEYRVKNQKLKQPVFLRIATKVILEKEFRNGGFYETAGAGHYATRERAKDIILSTAACNVPYLVFENFEKDLTIFHHRHLFDDRFLFVDSVTEEEKLLFFNPNGYQIPDATFALNEKSERSVCSRMGFVKGNILNAYDKYYALPETAKYRSAIKRPAWLRDVLMTGSAGWQAPLKGKNADFMKNINTMFLPRGRFIEAGSGELGWEWGNYPTTGKIRDAFGTVYTPQEVRDELQMRRDIRPGSKIGIYTWLWSSVPNMKIVIDNPDWFIFKTRGGSLASWFPGINTNLMRKWDSAESRQQAIDMEMNMIRAYNCDSLYLDGGNAGSFAKDWTTMTIDSPHSKNLMYAEMRKKVQEFKADGYLMFNAPMNPFADVGILENFAGAMTSEWRKGAAWMYKFKLFSYQDPLKCCFYIYWLSNVDGAFQNYMMGTGLMPAWFSRGLSLADVPYSSARYEVRGVEIVNSRITPNYRADYSCEVETMPQSQGGDALIFVNYHGKTPLTAKITAQAAPFGLTKGKKIYTHFMRFRDSRKFPGAYGEPDIQKGYRQSFWRSDRAMSAEYRGSKNADTLLAETFDLVPGQGGMWIVSDTPAVIWSADDLPAHSRLSVWPDMSIKGTYEKLLCETEYKKSEIAVIVPAKCKVSAIYVDGSKKSFYYARDGKALYAVVALEGAGKHTVKVETSALDAVPESKGKLSAAVFQGVLGGSLKIDGKAAEAEKTLSIYSDGTLVWSGNLVNNKFAITLPATVRDGKYLLQAALLDGTVLAEKKVLIRGFSRPTPLIDLMSHVPTEFKEDSCNVTRNNITLSRTALEYTKDTGIASVDTEKFALRVGSRERLRTFFGIAAAGGEFSVKRYCKIKLTGNFKFFNNYAPIQDHFVYNMGNHMAGIVFDFENRSGGRVRTLADLGVSATGRTSLSPQYCKLGKTPDYFFNLNNFANDKKIDEMTFWVDLQELGSPQDWTGKVFISCLLDNMACDRYFQVELLESADTPEAGSKAVKVFNRNAKVEPRTFTIFRLPAGSKVTFDWNSDLWKKVPALPALSVLGNAAMENNFPTTVKIASDDKNIYLFYNCAEDPGKPAETSRGARGEPYFSDSVEFYFQLNENKEHVMHCILDVAGHILARKAHIDPVKNSYSVNYSKPPFTHKIKRVNGNWHILITLSHASLAKKNTAFNVCRNRNVDGVMSGYTLIPGKSYINGVIYTIEDITGK